MGEAAEVTSEPLPLLDRSAPSRPWREPELIVLIILTLAVYFARLTDLSLRRDETLWARIAGEVVSTSHWVAPRLPEQVSGFHPPLTAWAIAASSFATGSIDTLAVRLPAALAMLATVLMIYLYARGFLNRFGSLASAAVYATMLQTMEYGRIGEPHSTYTYLASGSLILWHHGWRSGWPRARVWVTGYSLVALATLTGGLTAVPLFAAPVTIFLLATGQGRQLRERSHLAGIVLALGAILIWAGLSASVVGWNGSLEMLVDGQPRDILMSLQAIVDEPSHLLTFPMELVVCALPWAPLLLAYLHRDLRVSLGAARSSVGFLAICAVGPLTILWLDPAAPARAALPLFPFVAILIGAAIQGCVQAEADSRPQWLWRFFLLCMAVVCIGSLFIVPTIGAMPDLPPSISVLEQLPGGQVVAFVVVAALLGGLLAWASGFNGQPHPLAGVLSVASFMGVIYAGIVLSAQLIASEDIAGSVRILKRRLPANEKLVWIGEHNNAFAYHYGEAIQPWPTPANSLENADFVYFCYEDWEFSKLTFPLPFDWEVVQVISVDSARTTEPSRRVIVGRRILPGSMVEFPRNPFLLN